MDKRKNRLLACTIGICLSLMFSTNLFAYEKETHREITKEVVKNVESKISNVLTNEWKLEEGTNFSFRIIKGKSGNYRQLITQGSWEEDVPFTNCPKHFYDPTTGNGVLGFTDAISRGVDSVGTVWSYKDSKNYLYSALTAEKGKDRLANFGRMFYSLGRTIHLLEDMAVPSHVRNDSHMYLPGTEWLFRQRDMYEKWAEKAARDGILKTTSCGAVAISNDDIKDLWDETRDYGEAGDNTYIGMGLSEYTNHYFLSRDTIFREYTYPERAGCGEKLVSVEAEDEKIDIIKYLYTAEVDPLAKESLFYKYREKYDLYQLDDVSYQLDGNCHKAYSDKLIPRAVGYSAGLLDHFFRGKLDVTKKEAKRKSADNRNYDVTLKIKNNSGEAMSGGSFVLMYKKNETEYVELGSTSLLELLESGETLDAGAETKEWKINGATIEMPDYAKKEFKQGDFSKIEFTLAYKGKLGEESSVTIGKVFDEMEEIPPYYFHVQLSPSYVETGSPVSQTETFTIKVQCYNYGTSVNPPPEGTVNKLSGTESYVKNDDGEWEKEKINPDCQAPEAGWAKSNYNGEVSLEIVDTSGYELYFSGENLETLELADGASSISGVVIKAEDGNIGDNHLFLIISASDGAGNGNGALMVNPVIVTAHGIAGRYQKRAFHDTHITDPDDWNVGAYNEAWHRLVYGYWKSGTWHPGWIDASWTTHVYHAKSFFWSKIGDYSHGHVYVQIWAQKCQAAINLSGYAPDEIEHAWMRAAVTIDDDRINHLIGSIKNKTTGEVGVVQVIDDTHKYLIWENIPFSDFGSEVTYAFEPSINTEGVGGAMQLKPEYDPIFKPNSISGVKMTGSPQILFIPKTPE